MKKLLTVIILGLLLTTSLIANNNEELDYKNAIKEFKKSKSSSPFFKSSYGYAIFPTVGKAGIGVGGSYGKGRVYINGKYIADTSVTQLSFGFQLGGQAFSQIMFFQNANAFSTFKTGKFELGAQATAVAITVGVSANADYDNGIAIFTVAKGGLMYEAAVAGQTFSYEPK